MSVTFDRAAHSLAASRFLAGVESRLSELARESVDLVLLDVLQRWPVDSGRSRQAWIDGGRSAVFSVSALVAQAVAANGVDYSALIEVGTANRRGGFYVHGALLRARPLIRRRIGAVMRTEWGA